MLEEIRCSLLNEAKSSPQLLSDLAGLEWYVAESYSSRSLIELLQNADDAGASKFFLKKHDTHIIIANNGREFSALDIQSICRSAASTKKRGQSIGYRGIGFKSIIGLANEAHIISGEFLVTFSRELTSCAIPEAEKVPLLRIPHKIRESVHLQTKDEIDTLKSQGYKTFFIFSSTVQGQIDGEISDFDQSSLLFLKNISSVIINSKNNKTISITRENTHDNFTKCRITSNASIEDWLTTAKDGVSIAFSMNTETGRIEALSHEAATMHAFLPTLESSGLGIKINGDFSTDPSRTRIVIDQRTEQEMDKACILARQVIEKILSGAALPDSEGMLKSIIPIDDPRLLQHQKQSAKKELIKKLQLHCRETANGLLIKPAWLNSIDFEMISKTNPTRFSQKIANNDDRTIGFMRLIGATEAPLQEIANEFLDKDPSQAGVAELTAEIVRRFDTKQITASEINMAWEIIISEGQRTSMQRAASITSKIDQGFIDSISELGNGANGFERLLKALLGNKKAAELIHDTQDQKITTPKSNTERPILNIQKQTASSRTTLDLKKWRSAEEQIRNILELEGWEATDVSRQNIGYDIECSNGTETYFIEVKLVESHSKPFIMTSNEEAVARQKGDKYLIAIVIQLGDKIQISYIQNPAKNLNLTRQCRQWVWECCEYPFTPLEYALK